MLLMGHGPQEEEKVDVRNEDRKGEKGCAPQGGDGAELDGDVRHSECVEVAVDDWCERKGQSSQVDREGPLRNNSNSADRGGEESAAY